MPQFVRTTPTPAWSLLQLRTILNAQASPAIDDAEIPGVIEIAHQQNVAPYLYWKLNTLGIPLDTPVWAPLCAHYQTQTKLYLKNKHAAQKTDAALKQANIPALWLKGFALAHSVYPNPALRPMVDLDVLVPYAERARALQCLLAAGYTQESEMHTDTVQALWHHYRLRDEVMVELHYALLGMRTKLLPPRELAWFWQRTHPIHHQALEFTALTQEAELLYSCAHALLQHQEQEFNLQRALDLHLLVKQNPQNVCDAATNGP